MTLFLAKYFHMALPSNRTILKCSTLGRKEVEANPGQSH